MGTSWRIVAGDLGGQREATIGRSPKKPTALATILGINGEQRASSSRHRPVFTFDLLYARYQEPRLVWYCPSTTSDDPVHGGSGLAIALPRAYGILHSGFLHAVILSSHTKVSLYIWFSSP